MVCVDIDEERIVRLKKGEVPIYEPGLEEMVARNTTRGRLSFSAEIPFAIKSSDIIFIAVGTPALPNGDVDMSYVFKATEMIAEYMGDYKIIKSSPRIVCTPPTPCWPPRSPS